MKYLDLCTGMGSFGYVLEKKGFTTDYICELNENAVKQYNANFKEVENLCDIHKIDPTTLNDFDILTGALPFAGMSSISINENTNKEEIEINKYSFFQSFLNILNYKRPKHFIIENVRSLLLIHEGKLIDKVVELLSENYDVRVELLNATRLGLPINNTRLFIYGTDKNIGLKEEVEDVTNLAVADIYNFLDDNVNAKYYLTKPLLELAKRKQRKYVDKDDNEIFENEYKFFDKDNFNKIINLYSFAGSLGVSNYLYETHKIEKDCETSVRLLTPRECVRLKGFGDDFRLIDDDKITYRCIANSTSPTLIKEIVNKLI